MINLLVTIVLLWILWKIPFWVLASIRGRTGGSVLGSAVRAFVAYKTFGLLRGAATLLRHGRRGRPSSNRGDAASSDGADPYAAARATSDGQLMLPLPGLRRQRRRPSQPTPPHTAAGTRQRPPRRCERQQPTPHRQQRRTAVTHRYTRRRAHQRPTPAVQRVRHDGLRRRLPVFPGKRYLDWKLDDPAGQGSEAVRPIRDEISPD